MILLTFLTLLLTEVGSWIGTCSFSTFLDESIIEIERNIEVRISDCVLCFPQKWQWFLTHKGNYQAIWRVSWYRELTGYFSSQWLHDCSPGRRCSDVGPRQQAHLYKCPKNTNSTAGLTTDYSTFTLKYVSVWGFKTYILSDDFKNYKHSLQKF